MKEQYGEFELRYDDVREKFDAFKGDERIASSAKLPDLKKRLDRVGIVRAKFARYKVLRLERGGRYEDKPPRIVEWEVTSVVHGNEVWVSSSEENSRKKVTLASGSYDVYYADKPEVRKSLEDVVKLYQQQDALDTRITTQLKLIERASVPAGVETEAA